MSQFKDQPTATAASDLDISRRDFLKAAAATATVAGIAPNVALAAGTSNTSVYRIHPAIGIARLGNLDPEQGFIIGPEIPGQMATEPEVINGEIRYKPVSFYKKNGEIKRQAARFRVFEYQNINGKLTPVGEVAAQQVLPNGGFIKEIKWTVHLANSKASFYEQDGPLGETIPARNVRNANVTDRALLEIDFGPRTISGANAMPQNFSVDPSSGYPQKVVYGVDGRPLIDHLGQLRTDEVGRLMVLGGAGKAASNVFPAAPITHWSNNDNWFDDVADGPVTAVVCIDDGNGNIREVPVDAAGGAWVLVAPPDFSPGIKAGVTLYDILYDMGVRKLNIPSDNGLYAQGGPLKRMSDLNSAWRNKVNNIKTTGFEFGNVAAEFNQEIWPIIIHAVNLVYTTGTVNFKHVNLLSKPFSDPSAAYKRDRERFFSYLRAPEDTANNATGNATMPRMYGDNWYLGGQNFSFDFVQNNSGNSSADTQNSNRRPVPKYQRYMTQTPTQYALLRAWAAGKFQAPNPAVIETVITPHGLDKANLETGVGGAFYPGIECSWQIRNPNLFIEPFRLNLQAASQFLIADDGAGHIEGGTIKAGHFSRQMALPWQADFNDCSKALNLAWWPTARPDDVLLKANDKLTQRVPWARPDVAWSNGGSLASYQDMIQSWYKFGYVIEDESGAHLERERNSNIA